MSKIPWLALPLGLARAPKEGISRGIRGDYVFGDGRGRC
jgi:hypothetical protein